MGAHMNSNIVDVSREFPLTLFLSGVVFATFTASGLFFLKFWKKTRESFFLFFAFACWAIAFERVHMVLIDRNGEVPTWVYFFRLFAFFLILLATYQANRRKTRG